MEKAKELYIKILKTVSKGNDAEVRMDRDGNLVVYEVKKKKIVQK